MMKDWKDSINFYSSIKGVGDNRKIQAQQVYKCVNIKEFDRLEIIETGASQNMDDGCFGLLFAHLCSTYGGKFSSVDIDGNLTELSRLMYQKFIPGVEILHSTSDSVSFLENYDGSPNIVHLDSWDLDIYNPEPSMLHGFLEFLAIKDKMPSGSYIIIDDNFLGGTRIYWNISVDGHLKETKEFDVNQEILGKGSMIYHYVKKEGSGWEIIGDHYEVGPNIKLIIKKK